MKKRRGESLCCSGVTLYHVCPNDQLNKILTPDFFGGRRSVRQALACRYHWKRQTEVCRTLDRRRKANGATRNMARPLRCAASLRLAVNLPPFSRVSDPRSETARSQKAPTASRRLAAHRSGRAITQGAYSLAIGHHMTKLIPSPKNLLTFLPSSLNFRLIKGLI
jgi:hypothetical protein